METGRTIPDSRFYNSCANLSCHGVVLKKMAADLNMDLEVIICPTIREPDGLAMSSRNVYLNPQERQQAPVLYQALKTAHVMWSEGEHDADRLRQAIVNLILPKPLAKIEYISVANAFTLQEIQKLKSRF